MVDDKVDGAASEKYYRSIRHRLESPEEYEDGVKTVNVREGVYDKADDAKEAEAEAAAEAQAKAAEAARIERLKKIELEERREREERDRLAAIEARRRADEKAKAEAAAAAAAAAKVVPTSYPIKKESGCPFKRTYSICPEEFNTTIADSIANGD